ncbi:eukaryotic translation initiation factor 4g-like [Stylonychia lemnae]|uniref:Eukaryotic translation initiation factor 4g-like n=1 Tax=Stylonychia lemnae TaxID=5949 RepID=A0A078AYM7_STYLE|nr:eukaryotic translation initiation factor 4g-like [Stylonychia lemnae]|eukprot:CDW87535.1 eukaryotic translation initiation factor 4g-like [Stylonychia lemnae]
MTAINGQATTTPTFNTGAAVFVPKKKIADGGATGQAVLDTTSQTNTMMGQPGQYNGAQQFNRMPQAQNIYQPQQYQQPINYGYANQGYQQPSNNHSLSNFPYFIVQQPLYNQFQNSFQNQYYQNYQQPQMNYANTGFQPTQQNTMLNASQAPPFKKSLNLQANEFQPKSSTASQSTSKVNSPKNNPAPGAAQNGFSQTANFASAQLQNLDTTNISLPQTMANSISHQLNLGASTFIPTKKAQQTVTPQIQQTPQIQAVITPVEDITSKALSKLSESDQKYLKSLITKVKSSGKLTLELLKEFKTLDIAKQTPTNYYTEVATRSVIQKDEQRAPARGGYKPRGGQQNIGERDNQRGGHGGAGRGKQHYPPRVENDSFATGQIKQQQPVQNNNFTHHARQEEPMDVFQRQEANKFKQELTNQSKMAIEKARSEKNIEQQIKLICNIITPNNFDKKFLELRGHLFGDLKLKDEDGYHPEKDILKEQLNYTNMRIIVDRIFNKAQNEHEYCNFYGDLCQQMIKLELNLRNLDTRISNSKYSNFRKTLLEECKTSFEQFFSVDQDQRKQMNQDQLYKFQKKLMGNVRFVGELNRRQLLQDSIIISVLNSLIGAETEAQRKFVNDDTLEGAITLMNKIGNLIDDKLTKMTQEIQNPNFKADRKQKNEHTIKLFENIFNKFEEIAFDNGEKYADISLRVKILIKNMLDNKKSGWEKTKKQNEGGPKKVEDLRKEIQAKQMEEEKLREAEYYEEQQTRYYDNNNRRGGDRRDNKYGKSNTVYAKRGGRGGFGGGDYDTTSQGSYNNDRRQSQRQDRNQKYQAKNRPQGERGQQQEAKQMEDSQMAKNVVENFHAYDESLKNESESPLQPDHFNIFSELKTVYQKQGETIFYQFLNKVYDSTEDQIMKSLPNYLNEVVKTKFLSSQDITKGINKFLQAVPDLASDYPKIGQYLSKTLFTLSELGVLNYIEIIWVNDDAQKSEDDMIFVEAYFEIMAGLLNQEYQKLKDWKAVADLYVSKQLNQKFRKMKDMILVDSLFSDIQAEYPGQAGQVITALLQQNSDLLSQLVSVSINL